MTKENYKHLDCPIAQSLCVVGDQWALLIVRDALMGLSTFTDFEKSLGISKRMLSRRLTEMVADGLLQRQPIKDGGARMRYVPTQKARDMALVMASLIAWGEKWYPGKLGERYQILEKATGARVAPGMVVTETKTAIDLSECAFLPGPGAQAQ